MRLDAVIFGGGAAGLWLLDRLSRDGHHVVLLEAHALGHGQTVASQGIIHGGLKYTLSGVLTKSAKCLRDMPNVWREALLGRSSPNLAQTRLRSDCCYLWHTDSIASRAGMIGARYGLRVKPELVCENDRPLALRSAFGTVARLPEQVISPRSFIQDLSQQYADRILKIDRKEGVEFELDSPGDVTAVRLKSPTDGGELLLNPRQVIFTAGKGNARLRQLAGLSADVMQRRPLHMVMVRGDLPELNGHCLDGAKTRVTITTDVDTTGRNVWQIGGQIAEDGVHLDEATLIQRARDEINAVLPGINLRGTEWSTYTADRAEGATPTGARPESIQVLCAGNVTTGWPTKLVLAPVLAQEISSRATSPYYSRPFDPSPFQGWPRPEVALSPWDEAKRQWWTLDESFVRPLFDAA